MLYLDKKPLYYSRLRTIQFKFYPKRFSRNGVFEPQTSKLKTLITTNTKLKLLKINNNQTSTKHNYENTVKKTPIKRFNPLNLKDSTFLHKTKRLSNYSSTSRFSFTSKVSEKQASRYQSHVIFYFRYNILYFIHLMQVHTNIIQHTSSAGMLNLFYKRPLYFLQDHSN